MKAEAAAAGSGDAAMPAAARSASTSATFVAVEYAERASSPMGAESSAEAAAAAALPASEGALGEPAHAPLDGLLDAARLLAGNEAAELPERVALADAAAAVDTCGGLEVRRGQKSRVRVS